MRRFGKQTSPIISIFSFGVIMVDNLEFLQGLSGSFIVFVTGIEAHTQKLRLSWASANLSWLILKGQAHFSKS